MSYKIDGIPLIRRMSNEDKLCCESCQNSQADIYFCNLCYLFCCSACTKNHLCPSQSLEVSCKFQRIEKDTYKPLDLCKKVSQGGNPRFGELSNGKNQWNRSCQRCYITLATKSCLKCKIKHYCDHCFRSIHASSKMLAHSYAEIQNSKDRSGKFDRHEPKTIIKTEPSNDRNELMQKQSNQTSKSKEQFLNNLQTNLHFVKNSLLRQYNNHQNDTNQSINTISNIFHQLIEDINLKLAQITLKIRENSKNTLQRFDEIKKSMESQQRILFNLKHLDKLEYPGIPLSMIQNKKQDCSRQINELISFAQFNISRDPLDKKFSEISEQINQISQKISKIQIKKTFLQVDKMDSSKISSVSNTTSKNEKMSLKLPLNLSNIRSSQKFSPLTMSLLTPKRNQNAIKTPKGLQNGITKSLFVNQSAFNCPEEQMQKSLKNIKKNIDSKRNLQIKKIQGGSKDKKSIPTALLSPKASIKRFDKCLENSAKSKIAKTGINIEKTKKMIKDIRKEMIQFSNRYNSQKQTSQLSERQFLVDISQLSIESLIQKSNQI